jgi:hypothetical protein
LRGGALLAAFLLAALGVSAQRDLRVAVVPMVRVWIGPMDSGTEEEKDYFMRNMRMEFAAAGYEVASAQKDSHYSVALSVGREFDDPLAGTGRYNVLTLTLTDSRNGREIVSLGQPYQELTEMNDWNLYLITQAMANTPVIKIPQDAELVAGLGEASTMQLYLGLRAGGSLDSLVFQPARDYEGGLSQSFAGRAAVLLEFRPFRYFSVQAEAEAAYGAFNAARQVPEGAELVRTTDAFRTLSLSVPLLLKVPVDAGVFSVSPFAGAYYFMIWPLGPDGPGAAYKLAQPFGVSLGIDAGLYLGAGVLFLSLRFDQELGTVSENGGPRYSRRGAGLSLGYKLGLLP